MDDREFDSSNNEYIDSNRSKYYGKKLDWNMAIGLQKVDNLSPSKYLEKLLEKKYLVI